MAMRLGDATETPVLRLITMFTDSPSCMGSGLLHLTIWETCSIGRSTNQTKKTSCAIRTEELSHVHVLYDLGFDFYSFSKTYQLWPRRRGRRRLHLARY